MIEFYNKRSLADFASCVPDDDEVFAEYLYLMRDFTKGEGVAPWSTKEDSIKWWRSSFADFFRTSRVPLIRTKV